jgi:hypothetical protein
MIDDIFEFILVFIAALFPGRTISSRKKNTEPQKERKLPRRGTRIFLMGLTSIGGVGSALVFLLIIYLDGIITGIRENWIFILLFLFNVTLFIIVFRMKTRGRVASSGKGKPRAVIRTHRFIMSILFVIGVPLFLLGLLTLFSLLVFADEQDALTIGLALFLIMAGILPIYSGMRVRRRIKRFKGYVSLISGQGITNLERLVGYIDKPEDFIRKDIKDMIYRGLFANATIDLLNDEIVIASKEDINQYTAVNTEKYNCSRCGGLGIRQAYRKSNCEYCGSVVK